MGLGIKSRVLKICRQRIETADGFLRSMGKQKVFCIGCNKTGTTSLEQALKDLGFVMGSQVRAEKIAYEDWAKRDYRRLIRFCHTAQAFQDAPFSFPYTYQAVDAAFPGSSFILTVRDSSDQWYNSITKYHSKLWGDGTQSPTYKQLQNGKYHFKGRPWIMNRILFNTPENDPYRKEEMILYYERHNNAVIEYFRHRPHDLLVLNVANPDAYKTLCDFLGVSWPGGKMPWKNKT